MKSSLTPMASAGLVSYVDLHRTEKREMTEANGTIPETMKAVRQTPPGGVENLIYDDIATPGVKGGQVLVRVRAAAITRDELSWPADRLPATPSYELSGTIAAVGPGVAGWEVGQEVFAMTDFDRDGVAADYAVVAAAELAAKPGSLDHAAAAAIPLPGLSAMQGLFDHGGLTKNQRVLIHGGAGGVGSYAVQLARLHGAYVIATASGNRAAIAKRLGADEVVDIGVADFTEAGPVDIVFDTAGGERLQRSPEVLPRGGRLISVAEEPPTTAAESRGIEARWFLVQPRPGQLEELAALADDGRLEVPIHETYPMREASDAFRALMSAGGTGKIVLVND